MMAARNEELIEARRMVVDRVAESLGVAALVLDSGALSAEQMRLIASGLRDVRCDLEEVSDALDGVVRTRHLAVSPS